MSSTAIKHDGVATLSAMVCRMSVDLHAVFVRLLLLAVQHRVPREHAT
jgi:hypothetical protein